MKATIESASDLLFPLQYRGKALALLLLQPQRRLHVREIARLTGTVAGTMNKELDRLQRAGLLERHSVGNQLQYCANPQHPVYQELSALLRKTIGLADVLTLALTPVANRISVAFVFGSVAQGSDTALSDVDVMVIGEVDFGEVVNLLFDAQTTLQREINPKVFSKLDWHTKLATSSSFVLDVLAKPKLFLIGSQHDLDQLA
jgi:predicted nucleotidyltransferase/predicted transcriptional regulator